MTANDAIQKIRVLLGVEETVEVAMAAATLVDGTQVEVEGDFEVGKPLFVVTEEGNIPAPAGVHQTTDNLLVTVDESGAISQIEEVAPEAQEEEKKEEAMEEDKEEVALEEEKEEEMEEEVEEEMEEEEEMIVKIVEAMKPYFEEIKDLKEKVVEMEGKFQKFSKEPAAKPIKKAEAFEANRLTSVERIAKLRKSK